MRYKIFFGLLAVLFMLLILFVASLFQSANDLDQSTYKVRIPRGVSTFTIQQILEAQKILKPRSSFAIAAKILGVSRHIQAGEYELSPSDTLFEILLKLKKGDVEPIFRQVRITFPEGTSIYKMGEILKKNNVSDPDEFQELVSEGITGSLREKHRGIFKYMPTESLEGYLYPDTYWFFENVAVEDMAEIMVSRFDEILSPFWEKAKSDTDFTLHEVLTLASIIEKEAKVAREREIISSVFHNRLKKDMPLAADPTIKYALENPTKRVSKKQLSVDSAYNTYKRKGLPPGPICNPGIESIKAAVYPASTNYYFFVAKKDGSHIFSRNWDEHQKARIKASR